MPIRQLYAITIEFVGAAPSTLEPHPGDEVLARHIRLQEVLTGESRTFTLHEGDGPVYALSSEETARLDRLMGHLAVQAPWRAAMGFDGAGYELNLLGPMSSLTFRWWMDAPAEWGPVGMLYDYVMAVADGRRAEER